MIDCGICFANSKNMFLFTIKDGKDDFMAKLVAFYSRVDENYFGMAAGYISKSKVSNSGCI